MIPRCDGIEILHEVPFERLAYPTRAQIRENALGGFYRDTWPTPLGDWDHAAWIAKLEAQLVDRAAIQARTPEEFDDLALELAYDEDDVPLLDGLDLGVAGPVYALCAAYCPTRVSCAGHPDTPWRKPAWNLYPVVKFRADEARARIVLKAAELANCGLALNDEEGLLEVWAASITEMRTFADDMLARRDEFDALPVPVAAKNAMADLEEDPWTWDEEE